MKHFAPLCLVMLAGTFGIHAESPRHVKSSPAVVSERGPHHRTWNVVHEYVTSYGKTYLRTNDYIELGTGLNYLDNGQWKDTRAEIEIVNGAAVARQGQHTATFAANLNSAGAIELSSPDAKLFRSHILGLAYTDATSGQSVLIAETKDCIGGVIPPNQVYYQDAFEGDLEADVHYTYKAAGFEQDIIIITAPPSPAEWGLDPQTTRLEVWTEFVQAPQAQITRQVISEETDPVKRQQMAEPDLVDEHLDFGVMKMGMGYAFPLQGDGPFSNGSIPTGKSWELVNGRRFLIEKVDYRDASPHLDGLPQAAAIRKPAENRRMLARNFPQTPNGNRGTWKANQVAQVDLNRNGYVLDYVTLITSQTNVTFKSDTTYYVDLNAYLYGTTTIEGGAVIKYSTNAFPVGKIVFRDEVECLTDPWHPAIFTAKDDDSVGETIDGSTGDPTGKKYALIGLQFGDTSQAFDLHDIKIRYIFNAIAMESGNTLTLRNAQISHGNNAVWSLGTPTFRGQNLLINNFTNYAFLGGTSNNVEHGTFHNITNLANNASNPLFLTNTLLIKVHNNLYFKSNKVQISTDDSGIFQTVGSGSYYLATGSPYVDAGTDDPDEVSTTLLADLAERTTEPPVLLTNFIAESILIGRQAKRDDDTPDLGYHYDPIDYIASSLTISNASVLVTNAATIGIEFDGTNYGINFDSGASLVSQGFGEDLNRFVRLHAVQEEVSESGSGYSIFANVYGASSPPQANFRFTEFPLMSQSHLINEENGRGYMDPFILRDSQIKGGIVYLSTGLSNIVVSWTNTLFTRVETEIMPYTPMTLLCWNALFHKGNIDLTASPTGSEWYFYDTFFDETSLYQYVADSVSNNYNAYVTTNADRWTPTSGVTAVILSDVPVYDTGPLGRYYYPTDDGLLSTNIDAGSRYATNAGLYHFTTTTDQSKEEDSTVDIGFHYLAVDNDGKALDEDGDGIPDYLEDLNGNGSYDSAEGESDWETYDSLFGITSGPSLDVFTPLKN